MRRHREIKLSSAHRSYSLPGWESGRDQVRGNYSELICFHSFEKSIIQGNSLLRVPVGQECFMGRTCEAVWVGSIQTPDMGLQDQMGAPQPRFPQGTLGLVHSGSQSTAPAAAEQGTCKNNYFSLVLRV